jgi:actin-like ATPase involved in cell morphogenesis
MSASYYLAVDVGTSRTAAATSRLASDGSLSTASFPLGRNSDNVPTSMFVGGGELLFGDAAERRGITEPQRLVREFKRRVGDDVPLIVGDRRFRPEEAFALMVGWVVDTVAVREARLPSAIAVTVPAAWGTYRRRLVGDALARQGWSSVTLVTEPEAAARHYVSTNALAAGRGLAVYDLGGGTFDAIVLERRSNGDIDMVGAPTGIEDVGGADFDDAVVRHAIAAGGVELDDLADDGDQRVALAAFRRECVDAKEALSFDSEAVVPLLIGSGHGTVRITRGEFEQMIEEQIGRTADVLEEAIESAGVPLKQIDAILLTGGSSRIPRVSQLLSERFNRPIAIDADPKAIIALGAVRILSDRAGVVVAPPASEAADGLEAAAAADAKALLPADDVEDAGQTASRTRGRIGAFARKHRKGQAVAFMSAGTVVLALALVIPATGTSGDDNGPFTPSALMDALDIPSARAHALFGDAASAAETGESGGPSATGSGSPSKQGRASGSGSSSAASPKSSPKGSAKVQPGGPAGSTATAPGSASALDSSSTSPAGSGSDSASSSAGSGSGSGSGSESGSGSGSTSDPQPSGPPATDPTTAPPATDTATPPPATDTPPDTPTPTPTETETETPAPTETSAPPDTQSSESPAPVTTGQP